MRRDHRRRSGDFRRVPESSWLGLESPVVARGRSPGTAPPALRRQRRVTAAAHAAAQIDVEVGESDPPRLAVPQRAEGQDRVECLVGVHAY